MSLSSIVLNLIGIAVIVFIIMIIYKIIKGILEFFFYTAMDVKRFTDKIKDSKERKANIPIIVEDIIKSINSYCHDVDLIDYITVGSGHDDIDIKLKNGKQLVYSSYEHGYDVINHEPIAKALASRLSFTMEPLWADNVSDQGQHICGYQLLSDSVVKKRQELKEKEKNRIKV